MNKRLIFLKYGDFMYKKEICLIFLVILSIFAAFLCQKKEIGDTVVIISDGEIYAKVPLEEDTEISVKGKNTVNITGGRVYVSDADCPDKLCIHQGSIDKNGGVIVCLPNKLTVEIGD